MAPRACSPKHGKVIRLPMLRTHLHPISVSRSRAGYRQRRGVRGAVLVTHVQIPSKSSVSPTFAFAAGQSLTVKNGFGGVGGR
jgi:hypothetical protein